MRTVAAEAGVTATALYRHFENKDQLVRAVVRDSYALFVSSVAGSDAVPAAAEALRLGFERFLDFALRHPHDYELLFVTPHGFGIDRYPEDFLDGGATGFRLLRDLVGRCMEAGVLRQDVPGDVALTLYAHMHGLIMLHRAGRFAGDPARFRAFYLGSLERVVAGLV